MDKIYRVDQGGEPFYAIEREGRFFRARTRRTIFDGHEAGEPLAGLDGLSLRAPVSPSKIVCVGLNYKDHAAEVGKPLPAEPLLFLKPSTAILDPGAPIRLPPGVGRVDHEAELAVVIGRKAHRVAGARAWDYILGLTCVNDVTARDLQNREQQYTRCKGFDTFAPIGPCIATGLTGRSLAVEGWVNGVRRQASSTDQLIFGIEHLVEFITFVMTLEPGDVISTGTPSGIGPLADGDTVAVRVQGVGELSNPVQAE